MYWILHLICRTEAFDSIFKNTIKILYYFINLQYKMFILIINAYLLGFLSKRDKILNLQVHMSSLIGLPSWH